jgi:DNA-binding XRE family transcriptional regulator/predicted RNase H-like HicB family nuclease
MEYIARVVKERRRYVIDFPDAPGCQTFAERKADVHARAREALEGWLEAHLAAGSAPPPPPARRRPRGPSSLRMTVPPMLAVRLGVRRMREELGLSQSQLAERVGVSKQAISQLESPDANIRMDTLERIARALGLEVDIVLRRRDETGEFAAAGD